MTLAIFLGSLVLFMVLGMPIAFALVLTGVALMFHLDFFDAQLVAQNLLSGADNFPLMAVPFFILAGELMNAGGISRRIINLAVSLVGHIQGGLGYVAIAAAVLLASLSGSAIADTAALATLLIPMMRDHGYSVPRSAGLIASGGIIAPIIPPSMPFIIFGVTTNTSISNLFLAGVVPGILMGVALVIVWTLLARKMKVTPQPKATWNERGRAVVDGIWALMLPVIILGGLRGGLFTPTEAAVVAVAYGLFIGIAVHRSIAWRDLYPIFREATEVSSVIMLVLALAGIFAYSVNTLGIADPLVAWVKDLGLGSTGTLILLFIVMTVLGMVLDGVSIFLVFLPLLYPLMLAFHWDPVWFGVLLTMKIAIGQFTPPMAVNLMVACRLAHVRIDETIPWVGWLIISFVLATLLVLFVPEIALWLPRRLGY